MQRMCGSAGISRLHKTPSNSVQWPLGAKGTFSLPAFKFM